MLNPGDKAPSFALDSTQGEISLGQYLGARTVLLIFYPQDATPG